MGRLERANSTSCRTGRSGDQDNPLSPMHGRMRAIDRDLIREGHYGQRSWEPRKQAGHMTAPDQCCSSVRKFLPRRRPHMTQSGHANRIAAWDSCSRSRALDLRSSPIQSRRLSFICSSLLTGRPAGTSFFWSVLSEEKEGTPKCSRRPPNQATSCQLCPTACRPVCLPERQRGTSVPAKRSFIPETLVMAAIASIEAYSRLTLSQSVGRH